MTTSAIEIDGVTKAFRARPRGRGKKSASQEQPVVTAVDAVSLRIERREIVALLGPNGAGKTSTLDMVLGLTQPTRGTVDVLGVPPRRAIAAGKVSAVLQSGGLLAGLTVRETLRYISSTFEDQAGRVEDVLERANLTALADRRVNKCSGGEQQRLRFAIALLPEPELLILDEPTAGMDVSARREFWDAMRGQADLGRTVVFATHYLEEADDFADRIVLMSGGRVVADDSTQRIRARATGRVVSAEVVDLDDARRRVLALDAAAHVETVGDRLVVRSGSPDQVALVLLRDLGAHDLEVTTGSLEDAFVQITAEAER